MTLDLWAPVNSASLKSFGVSALTPSRRSRDTQSHNNQKHIFFPWHIAGELLKFLKPYVVVANAYP